MPQTPPTTLSPTEQQRLYQQAVDRAKQASRISFKYFVNNVFKQSFTQVTGENTFIGGEYIDEVADHLQQNSYTINITGRDHFKSTRLYADIMWAIFTDQGN